MAKVTNKKLLEAAKRYKEICTQEAQLKKEKDELKEVLKTLLKDRLNEDLKTAMKDRSLNELILDIYKITYNEFDVERFDTKSFAEDHKKMYEKYLYIQTQERLQVNLGK